MNHDSSFLQSSLNTLPQQETTQRNFLKYLHEPPPQRRNYYLEEQYPQSSPVIKKHFSQEHFVRNNTPFQPQKSNAFHNRFCQSIVQSSHKNKNSPDLSLYQKQLADLSAREIMLSTQNDLLRKQIKRLKQETLYLSQKNQTLQKSNELLLAYKSKAQILEREYNILAGERQSSGNNKEQKQVSLPYSLEQNWQNETRNKFQGLKSSQLVEKYLKGKETNSKIISNQISNNDSRQKINWKKVNANHPSPIYKIEPYRKYNNVTPYDELPLIESKVDNTSEEQEEQRRFYSPNITRQFREQARTIDLKDFEHSKSKEAERKCQSLQQQLLDIRRKNIDLYKKCEQFQTQKLTYLQTINQLKYEKTKQNTDLKSAHQSLQKQVSSLTLQLEANNINILQLTQQISNQKQQLKLLVLEKQQLQGQLQSCRQQASKKYEIEHKLLEEQYKNLKDSHEKLKKQHQQLEIEKKVVEHELEELQAASSVDSQKETELSMQLLLAQQNVQQLQDSIAALTQENLFLKDNCQKLTKIFELEKIENNKLQALRNEWRQIEQAMRSMKKIDLAVDHLWQIKEVQYSNINTILQQLPPPSTHQSARVSTHKNANLEQIIDEQPEQFSPQQPQLTQ